MNLGGMINIIEIMFMVVQFAICAARVPTNPKRGATTQSSVASVTQPRKSIPTTEGGLLEQF